MEDWGKLCEDISKWIKKYADENGISALVVGVSGGIDSAVTSTLCAKSGLETIAVNMPIHQESSQYDLAKRHIEWLESRWANVSSHLVDLTESYDSYVESALDGLEISELSLANTRARLRMTTLYAISGSRKGIVVGTGNKVEDFGVGFYTKYGDGGVDISPIADLLKSEVYALAKEMSVIEDIQNSIPNDGLWADGRTDEDQIGATYEEIEWAMAQADRAQREGLSNRQKEVLRIYQKLHESNSHKMKPIPIYIKNS
ncbi:MAG TPA: NAD(+) synthase [Candidatus Poseidoniales archaeon]|nr:MAG TPA: NAD(+) synthase [Candidatus Poseidoniales archaeon]HII52312.1 NAD(+) synthase [Candidatus Thalassarchaeaceae archaeon]